MTIHDKVASATTSIPHRRYIISIGLLFLMMLAYMDRVNFSVAGPLILREFGLSSGQFGLLSSAFNWTYLVMLVPIGILSDRIGPRIALPVFIVIWSVAAGATGFATGFTFLLLVRMLLGIGESPINTAGQIVIREWTPEPERATVASMFNSGALVGPAVGSVLSAVLIASFGWRASFLFFGVFGVLVGVVWYLIYAAPEKARWLSASEREYIAASRETHAGVATDAVQRMSLLKLLSVPTIWGVALAQGTLVYTGYLFLTFMPLYLVQVRGLADFGAGWVTGVTYGIATVGCLLIGWVADRIVRRAEPSSKLTKRRWSVIIAILASAPLLVLPLISSTTMAIAVICWVLAFNFAGISLIWALVADLTVDKNAIGRQFALITIGGNIMGLLAPIVTGYVVDATGSYTVPFVIAGLLAVVGALLIGFLARWPLQNVRARVAAG
jgi:MFS family permease